MAATLSLRHLSAPASKENVRESDTGSADEMLEIGDFRIDTRGHRVTLRGEPLELTGEEFDVLVFLTTNPQRVVTPQTALATNWPGARTQQTQFLRVLLSLRKKLENAATGQQYLRTESFLIYRFDPACSPAR